MISPTPSIFLLYRSFAAATAAKLFASAVAWEEVIKRITTV